MKKKNKRLSLRHTIFTTLDSIKPYFTIFDFRTLDVLPVDRDTFFYFYITSSRQNECTYTQWRWVPRVCDT